MRGVVVAAALTGLVLLGITAMGTAGSDEEARRLELTGSSTVAPLAAEIARRFEVEHPGVRVDVQTGGSSRGIADARSRLVQVGMVSRELTADEGADLTAHPVARDGVALVVHADNPVPGLDSEQVRAIWRGEVEDWSELGGPPGPVTVVHKAEGRATLVVFLEHFGLRNAEVEADVIVGDNQQGIRTVAGNPGAVGYVSVGEVEVEAARGVPIRVVRLDGVEPTPATVADGSYGLGRMLNLVTPGEPSGLAAEFVEYARSPAVRDLVRAQGFVPVAGG